MSETSNQIKIADLFAGIGGFRLGIQQVADELDIPVKCVFSSEIEKNAVKIYEKNFKETPSGDITKIQASDIRNVDILCAGFPCQDVSTAGKRVGLCGSRTGLFFEVIRIAREKQPKIIFLENVAGLLTSNGGWDFARVLIELENVGYEVEAELLNSKDFGVAQRRERVFIIGHLRAGRSTGKVFPIGRKAKTYISKSFTSSSRYTTVAPIRNLHRNLKNYPSKYFLTLDTCDSNGIIDNRRIRVLTQHEREKLQGFPIGWTDGVSETARRKLLGNAVSVPVIKAIALKLLPLLMETATCK